MTRIAPFLAALLLASSAYAGGATDSLLLSNGATAVPSPASLSQMTGNVSGSDNVSATFASAPASGDLLVAFASDNSTAPTAATGWTVLTTVAGCTYSRQATIAYRIAGASEPTTATPFNTGAATVGVEIFDVSGAPATWAAAYQGLAATCGANVTSVTVTETTGTANTLALAAALETTNGDYITGPVTVTGSYATPDFHTTGTYNAVMGSYASFAPASSSATTTITFTLGSYLNHAGTNGVVILINGR